MDYQKASYAADDARLAQLTEWSDRAERRELGNQDFLSLLSAHFLICTEKIRGNGEDCGVEAYNETAGLIGVFDGCGGIGAKRCPAAGNRTEAYLASRAAGNACKIWFEHSCEKRQLDFALLRSLVTVNLEHCRQYSQSSGFAIRGSLVRPYPTTMAAIVSYPESGALQTHHIWAGDSRTYFLDANGLAQISTDDTGGGDAMSNLLRDGALTNVIAADGRFALHCSGMRIESAGILIAATDGCFGYVPSPMEFEYILLSTLLGARNINEWKYLLQQEFAGRSGDDQTIAVEAVGFDSFQSMQGCYAGRFEYISAIHGFCASDSSAETAQRIWNGYRAHYYRFVSRAV